MFLDLCLFSGSYPNVYVYSKIYLYFKCAAWSWYLANDMQFYVIAPLFMIPLFM